MTTLNYNNTHTHTHKLNQFELRQVAWPLLVDSLFQVTAQVVRVEGELAGLAFAFH